MDRTSNSVKARQIQAALVIPHTDPRRPEVKWMIVDGERRWRGLLRQGKGTIKIIYDPENTRENLFSSSFAANFCRAGHTHAETARSIEHELESGKTHEEIADMVGRSVPWVRNEHSLLKLHPDLLKRMDPPTAKNDRLSMKVALLLTQASPDKQLHHYERAKQLKADAAFHKLRTSRTFTAAAATSPSDDRRYLTRKLKAIQRNLEAFHDVPRAMLKSLAPEALDEVEAELKAVDQAVAKCRERLARARRGQFAAYD